LFKAPLFFIQASQLGFNGVLSTHDLGALHLEIVYLDGFGHVGTLPSSYIFGVLGQLPGFSANNPPAHAREKARKSLPGAGLRADAGVRSAH